MSGGNYEKRDMETGRELKLIIKQTPKPYNLELPVWEVKGVRKTEVKLKTKWVT